jgi:hypothetical protein
LRWIFREERFMTRIRVSSCVVPLLGAVVLTLAGSRTTHAQSLLSQGRPVTASSQENAGTAPANAVDGSTTTRWSSAFSNPQWIRVDLGTTASVTRVVLSWEAAYGTAYQIQVSNDGTTWTSIFSTTTGNGGTDDLTGLAGSGRYVRMNGTARATPYGFSLWELQVYGTTGATPTATVRPTVPATATATAPPRATATATAVGATLLSQGRPATASSQENAGTAPGNAVDGSTTTRWSSAFSNPQWIQVDLGTTASISRVLLHWEAAYGTAYQILTSSDGVSWTPIFSTTTGNGAIDDLTGLAGSGRYVRMNGTARATAYGFSLWEFQVYGSVAAGTPTATPTTPPRSTATATARPGANPDFGPSVDIFDPSMPASTIQSRVNAVFTQQERSQFGTQRNAFLFKPGSYSVDVNVGYDTHVAGLGLFPGDVTISGAVRAEADWFGGNATHNFWRMAENVRVIPASGTDRWAVSQAAPYRRMHVQGSLRLDDGGWSSGGFISDSRIEGTVFSGSQQQWFSRNSQLGAWNGGSWNMFFLGVSGAPPNAFPNPPHTTLGQTPVVREKPFVYIDGAGGWNVFVPALRTNASGTTWGAGTPAGTSIPIAQFHIVKAGATAATINAALAQGLNLLVAPGIYHVNDTIRITRADTVVLGLGLATIIPDNGVMAMSVADVDGVKIAGILIDAGTTSSPLLLEVGPAGSSADHSANPTSLHDLFVRVGGMHAGRAAVSVRVNSHDVIGDHLWLWRGDHGTGIGWNTNTAANGLVVNGNDVTMYGLFVEHYQQYQTIWNGNGGRTYFYQNEFPYDPPNQAAWMNGSTNGWAAYKVGASVTSHEAWGLGAYCAFHDRSVIAARAIEAPVSANVRFHSMVTVSLGGAGTISRIVNDTGGPSTPTSTNATLVNYP